MTTRDERRAQKDRNLSRWRRIIKTWTPWRPVDTEWVERSARKHANHGKLCSCEMCGNRRATEGETIQERRHQP